MTFHPIRPEEPRMPHPAHRRHSNERPHADNSEGVSILPGPVEDDADPAGAPPMSEDAGDGGLSPEASAIAELAQHRPGADAVGQQRDEPEHVSPEAPRAPKPRSIAEMAAQAREAAYEAARWDLRELFERLADLEDGAVPTGPDAAAVLALIDRGPPDALILEDLRPGTTTTRQIGLLEADRKPLAPARIEAIIAKIRARRVAVADAQCLRDNLASRPTEATIRAEITAIDAEVQKVTASLLQKKAAALAAVDDLKRAREDLAAFEADAREAFADPIVSTIFEGER